MFIYWINDNRTVNGSRMSQESVIHYNAFVLVGGLLGTGKEIANGPGTLQTQAGG